MMRRVFSSLQWRLAAAFSLAALVLSLAAGGTVFYDIYHETHKLQDDLLRQVSAYVQYSGSLKKGVKSKKDAHILVFTEQNPPHDGQAVQVFARAQKGFYEFAEGKKRYRAYLRETDSGWGLVAQETGYREDLAMRAAQNSALPLLVMLPLMLVLTVLVVHRNMRPVRRLSQEVEQRAAQELAPLPVQDVPSEIQGFVSAINRLLAKTDGFVRSQQRFIADASHELRTPLTALSLQTEQLQQMPLDGDARAQVALLRQGILRSRHLMEQLLSLARLQNAPPEPPQDVPLDKVFRRAIGDIWPLAAAKSQDVGDVSGCPVTARGQEADFYLLAKTLLDNAVRYTPPESRIDISAEETASEWIIRVEDNGPGIPEAERACAVEPFYRILGTQEQGSGLGLAIAAEIARRCGGSLKLADSIRFPHGLLAEIRLPKPV